MAWFEHIDLNRDHRCSPRMFGYGLPLPGEKKSPNLKVVGTGPLPAKGIRARS